VGGVVAQQRFKGRQLLPGTADLRLGLRSPPTARAGGAALGLLAQRALKATSAPRSCPPVPLQERASEG